MCEETLTERIGSSVLNNSLTLWLKRKHKINDTIDSGKNTFNARAPKICQNIHVRKSAFQKLTMEFSRIYCASSNSVNKPETQIVFISFI